MSSEQNLLMTRVASYLFSVLIIAPGIPVYFILTILTYCSYSISVRYNLFVGRLCNKRWAYFWGVIFPWIISFIFTGSSAFASLLNWSALLFTGRRHFCVSRVRHCELYHSIGGVLRRLFSKVHEIEDIKKSCSRRGKKKQQ